MGAVDPQIIEYSPEELAQLRHEGLLRLFQDTGDCLWEVLELSSFMTSEREKLEEVREIVLNLKRLEEER